MKLLCSVSSVMQNKCSDVLYMSQPALCLLHAYISAFHFYLSRFALLIRIYLLSHGDLFKITGVSCVAINDKTINHCLNEFK